MVGQEELYARISDAPWAANKYHITVGGAGGLGSWVSFFLSRIGHTLEVYDHDVVSDANIGGGQLYEIKQIGMLKTEALRQSLWRFSGDNQFTAYGTFTRNSPVSNICIATFDNMESRKLMLEAWLELIKSKDKSDNLPYAFINVSMLPEGGFIEVVDRPSRVKRWKDEWVPSHEIKELVCTFKSTTHNASLMAAQAVGMLNNIIFNKMVGEQLRYVPYKTIVDQTLMTFNHEE